MWQLGNRTPFAAERTWLRDRDGFEVWIVAVKASFDIVDGAPRVADDQAPVLRLPEHLGDARCSSLRLDADLVLTKQATDVLVLGRAHAPAGVPVTQMDVGFRVGPIRKVLRVFGDRHWGALAASTPKPFEAMPLTYERAYGGVDTASAHPDRDWEWRNPVGTGFAVSGRHAKAMRLPNIERPDAPIRSWSDRPEPAGFGPTACHWQPRAGFAGTYDDHWMKTRQPLWAEDLDERYFQSAPVDQQVPGFLRGGEPVALRGLTEQGRLDFTLPKVYLGFETYFTDGSCEIHRSRRLHTVIIEPDGPRLQMVWHSALPCHFKVHQLLRTVITLKAGRDAGAEAS
jgi:hypothetical protein